MSAYSRPFGGGKSPANGMRYSCVDTMNGKRRAWFKCPRPGCPNEYRTQAKANKCCKNYRPAQ